MARQKHNPQALLSIVRAVQSDYAGPRPYAEVARRYGAKLGLTFTERAVQTEYSRITAGRSAAERWPFRGRPRATKRAGKQAMPAPEVHPADKAAGAIRCLVEYIVKDVCSTLNARITLLDQSLDERIERGVRRVFGEEA